MTVGALIHLGVGFVGTYLNFVQRAVVFTVAVMGTRGYDACNALIGFVTSVHGFFLLLFVYHNLSMTVMRKIIGVNFW